MLELTENEINTRKMILKTQFYLIEQKEELMVLINAIIADQTFLRGKIERLETENAELKTSIAQMAMERRKVA